MLVHIEVTLYYGFLFVLLTSHYALSQSTAAGTGSLITEYIMKVSLCELLLRRIVLVHYITCVLEPHFNGWFQDSLPG